MDVRCDEYASELDELDEQHLINDLYLEGLVDDEMLDDVVRLDALELLIEVDDEVLEYLATRMCVVNDEMVVNEYLLQGIQALLDLVYLDDVSMNATDTVIIALLQMEL